MVLIYANPGERMLVWDPFLRVHYLPSKRTRTGLYGEGICITVSRLLNFKRIEKLKKDAMTNKKKLRVLRSLEKDLGVDLYSKDWKIKIRNKFIKVWKRVGRILGMKPEEIRDIERFEYVKFRNPKHYLPNVTLIGIGLGMLDAMSSDHNLYVALDYFKKGYDQGVKKYNNGI